MAKITSTELFRFENFDRDIIGKPVGNNRTVTHSNRFQTDSDGMVRRSARQITGSLHGHAVVTLSEIYDHATTGGNLYRLKLDTCGHPTSTTRAAMADFMAAMGFKAQVSMAGGELSCALFFKDGGQHRLKSGGSKIVAMLTPKDMAEFVRLYELA